jgi:hypothetical protein
VTIGGDPGPGIGARLGTIVFLYTFFFLSYGLCNRLIPLSRCHDLATPLDARIPFVPAFVFPFWLTYLSILLPALVIRDRALFTRSAGALVVLIFSSCLLFLLFPVHVPRPETIPDSLAGRMVGLVYRLDRPVCAFPSLHVSASVLATAILFRRRRLWGRLFLPVAALSAVSTLFIKQHVLADLAGGVTLALLVDWAILGGKGSAEKG